MHLKVLMRLGGSEEKGSESLCLEMMMTQGMHSSQTATSLNGQLLRLSWSVSLDSDKHCRHSIAIVGYTICAAQSQLTFR
jgi:hypothetical protein